MRDRTARRRIYPCYGHRPHPPPSPLQRRPASTGSLHRPRNACSCCRRPRPGRQNVQSLATNDTRAAQPEHQWYQQSRANGCDGVIKGDNEVISLSLDVQRLSVAENGRQQLTHFVNQRNEVDNACAQNSARCITGMQRRCRYPSFLSCA